MSVKATIPNARTSEPATMNEIREAETLLGVNFPEPLRDLYLECDGFREPKGNAKYLLSLTEEDFIGSLVNTARWLWSDEEYWRSTAVNPAEFIFFGYSSADEIWGIRFEAPHKVIQYHRSQGDEVTNLDEDILGVYRSDFQKYEDLDLP